MSFEEAVEFKSLDQPVVDSCFAVPSYICPYCEHAFAVTPVERIPYPAGAVIPNAPEHRLKAINAVGTCLCRHWTVSLPQIRGVCRQVADDPRIAVPHCHR